MALKISFACLFLIVLICNNLHLSLSDEECQLTRNNDMVDDCNCRISDLNELNNQRLHPLLRQIVQKNYFRFFPVNLKKKCQFWPDHGHCSLQTCAIKACPVEKLPETLRETFNSNKIARSTHSQSDEQCPPLDTNVTLGINQYEFK